MNKILLLGLFVMSNIFAQNSELLKRMQVIMDDGGTYYYNVDGYSVTSKAFDYDFSEKGLKKVYRKYSVKKKQLKIKNKQLNFDNFQVKKIEEYNEKVTAYSSIYFIKNLIDQITVIQINSINTENAIFEKKIATMIINNDIPETMVASVYIKDSINFAGRRIALSNNECNWMGVNKIQCPYYGEMNWVCT